MSPEDTQKLAVLKEALKKSQYFVVNKSTPFEPCFLLYRRNQAAANTYVLKRNNIDRFVTEVKRIANITVDLTDKKDELNHPVYPAKEYWWQKI